jgi:glyoxylase-like metal-dependent hydrolase (beta-lactamase superfamily II)
MITVHKFTFNPFQENTYVLSDETNECIIIDPGCYEQGEKNFLADYIASKNLKPVKLVNTHCHIDHILGNYFVAKKWKLDLWMNDEGLKTLHNVENYAGLYGFEGYQISPDPAHNLSEGDELAFGNSKLSVIYGPGHCPGHLAFYSAEDKFLINGDILFEGSFGRVDLPGGDFDTLKKTIMEKMFVLPDDTVVYTGHGGETTIGVEKVSNPINWMEM